MYLGLTLDEAGRIFFTDSSAKAPFTWAALRGLLVLWGLLGCGLGVGLFLVWGGGDGSSLGGRVTKMGTLFFRGGRGLAAGGISSCSTGLVAAVLGFDEALKTGTIGAGILKFWFCSRAGGVVFRLRWAPSKAVGYDSTGEGEDFFAKPIGEGLL